MAFFDLDDTIIEGSAGVILAKILTRFESDCSKWKEFWDSQTIFQNNQIPYEDKIRKLSHLFAKGFTDTEFSLVERAVKQLSQCIETRPSFSGLFHWLVENEFKVFVLTASPVEVFNALEFQFTETHGLVLEKDVRYTGRCLLLMTPSEKERVIGRIVNDDTTFSFGVTDSTHDLPAYEKLDVKFLLNDSHSQDNHYFTVSNFLQVKQVVASYL